LQIAAVPQNSAVANSVASGYFLILKTAGFCVFCDSNAFAAIFSGFDTEFALQQSVTDIRAPKFIFSEPVFSICMFFQA
jgi:hypothetical protein